MSDDLQRKGTVTVAISLTVNVFLAGLKLIVGGRI